MNTEGRERCPKISEVPAKYQLEFSAYCQSRRSGWMTAEQWMAHREPSKAKAVAGTGQAARVATSPGTTKTEGTGKSLSQAPIPQPPSQPVTVTDLGHRFVGTSYPRNGEPLNESEMLHESTGEPVTRATTSRKDF